MVRRAVVLAFVVLLGAAPLAQHAQARTRVNVNLGIGVPGVMFAPPPPVMFMPPPRTYWPPPVVYSRFYGPGWGHPGWGHPGFHGPRRGPHPSMRGRRRW